MSSENFIEPSDLDELNKIFLQNPDKVVIVDFYATWCGPCKAIAPVYETLRESNKNMIFCKVDVDEAEDVCAKYDVKLMPTFLFFKNGQQIDILEGGVEEELVEKVKKNSIL